MGRTLLRLALVVINLVFVGILFEQWLWLEWLWVRVNHASPTVPTRVFVVLDTVRADHLSVCGYGRPTSPTLVRLSRDGALTCRAHPPSSWTLPSHASFFTGELPPVHGAHRVRPDAQQMTLFEGTHSVRPLNAEQPTLAETLRGEGFQTAMVSGNPVLGPATGLTRGFERALAPVAEQAWFPADEVVGHTRRLLRELDPERPLFLFVNLTDAHEPYEPIPRRADWGNPNPKSEAERIVDGYDLGIQLADAGLQGVLDALADYGWWGEGALLVVTSDHGELLGEVEGAFGHSGARLHAGLTDVPLLVRHEGAEPPELWDGMPALAVYDLLQGRTPARQSAVAVAFTAGNLALEAAEPGVTAIWSDDDAQRVQWTADGVSVGTRTAEGWSDEAMGEEPPALLETLQPLIDRLPQAYTDPDGLDPGTEEALRALGYLE